MRVILDLQSQEVHSRTYEHALSYFGCGGSCVGSVYLTRVSRSRSIAGARLQLKVSVVAKAYYFAFIQIHRLILSIQVSLFLLNLW